MVTFQEEGHKYTNEKGEQYISVTTLIGKYKTPFDSDYWSTYKALKFVLEKKGSWSHYKQRAGGWERVVEFHKQNLTMYEEEIRQVKQQFLQQWDKKGRDAREAGTAYHQAQETTKRLEGHDTIGGKQFPVQSPTDLLALQEFAKDGIYNELLLYNDYFKVAGTADKVIKQGRTIDIHDYKTSEEIEMQSFQDTRLKHPLQHLPACNFYEYSIQLSIYAWMLEVVGYHIGNLAIEHVKDNNRLHPVKYLRDEVQNLLSHYGEQVLHIPRFNFPHKGESIDFSISL